MTTAGIENDGPFMTNRRNSPTDTDSGIGRRRVAARDDATSHYNERRAALRNSAAELFKEHGLRETSLDQIAQKAGVDRSSLYYYVSGKNELFLDVVSEAIEMMAKRTTEIANENTDSIQKIEKLCHALMENYSKNYPHLYVFIQEKMTKEAKSKQMRSLRQFERNIEGAIIKIIVDGIDQGVIRSDISPKIAAYGILGMFNWTHRWFRPEGPVTSLEVGQTFATMVISGLRSAG